MTGYVYILKSLKNGRYYIGSTNDVERRLSEHIRGKSRYTRDTGPYNLVFAQEFDTLQEARKAERWIKNQKDQKLIDRIIAEGLTKTFI